MERIEMPAIVYWQSKHGKRFISQEDCEKYEKLFDKWQNPVRYREFKNVEGQLCHAYWVESKEELDDVTWFIQTKLDNFVCNHIQQPYTKFKDQWVVVYQDYAGDLVIESIEDFRDELDKTLKAVNSTLSTVVKLIWEKA